MSINSQEKNMQRLGELLGQDLTYIYGEKESGPNGAKKEFLDKGRTFLRALAKDLGFQESKVTSNAAGVGSPGDVSLYGMWSPRNGLYLVLEPPTFMDACALYRTITELNHSTSGRGNNNFISLREFSSIGYEAFCAKLRRMNREETAHERAA